LDNKESINNLFAENNLFIIPRGVQTVYNSFQGTTVPAIVVPDTLYYFELIVRIFELIQINVLYLNKAVECVLLKTHLNLLNDDE
jgi:hypothetical protein